MPAPIVPAPRTPSGGFRSPAGEPRVALLAERGDALGMVVGADLRRLERRLRLELLVQSASSARLSRRFVRPIATVGPAASRRARSRAASASRSAGDDGRTRPRSWASPAPSWRSPIRISKARCRPTRRTSARARPESGTSAMRLKAGTKRASSRRRRRRRRRAGLTPAPAATPLTGRDHRLRQVRIASISGLYSVRTRGSPAPPLPPRRSAPTQNPDRPGDHDGPRWRRPARP